jgi:hypothetical protein
VASQIVRAISVRGEFGPNALNVSAQVFGDAQPLGRTQAPLAL